MPPIFLVMLGGAAGAAARYEAGRTAFRLLGPGLPWSTLFVNLFGGFLMGLLAGGLARASAGGEAWRLLLGVGVLGGFTTFSSFSLETWTMLSRGELAVGLGYVLASVIGAVAALWLGLVLVRVLS